MELIGIETRKLVFLKKIQSKEHDARDKALREKKEKEERERQTRMIESLAKAKADEERAVQADVARTKKLVSTMRSDSTLDERVKNMANVVANYEGNKCLVKKLTFL